MTFVLGIASLVQAIFLPGYLLVRYVVKMEGLIRTSILTLCFSLLINHLLVYMLTAVHLYSRSSLSIVLAIEVALLLICRWRYPGSEFTFSFSGDLIRFRTGWGDMTNCSLWLSVLHRAVFFTAMATLAYFAFRFFNGFGTIFDQWDDVVSWNRWAVDWYLGRFPTFTWHYPQLLPSVWSITYQLTGTSDIQFFAKGIMGLFPLMMLIALFDLWLRSGAVGYLAGIPVTAFLLLFANGVKGVGSGYADVPVAFMAFVPVYLLLTTADETDLRKGVLFAGSVITAAAALTKQSGLFILLLYPLVSILVARESRKKNAGLFPVIAACFLVAAALLLPWYLYTERNIQQGKEQSEIKLVTADIHQGRGYLQRVANIPAKIAQQVKTSPNLERVTNILGASLIDGVQVTCIILLAIFVLALSSLREPLWRVPVVLVMLPFTAIWLVLYSYDFRNLSLVLPYLGAGAGLSVMRYGGAAVGRLPIPRFSPGLFAFMGAVLLAGSGFLVDRSSLVARQMRLQREVGNPQVNRFIYTLDANESGKIATNYQLVQYLPGLDKKYLLANFDDAGQTAAMITSNEARYLLVFVSDLSPSSAVKSLLLDLERSGDLQRMQSPSEGYSLFRVRK